MTVLKQASSQEKIKKFLLFCIPFSLVLWYIYPISPIGNSGDAANIWTAIVGLATGEPEASYVMYKGILSCYPYVWFYQLSQALGVSEFFFLKIYHAILFAYVSVIAFPNIYLNLTGKEEVNTIRRVILAIVMFLLWKDYLIFDQLMIDLPSMACFIASVSGLLSWKKRAGEYPYARIVLLFFLIGCGSCFSGQYSIAMLILLCYAANLIIQLYKRNIYSRKHMVLWGICISVLLLPRVADMWFFSAIVNPLVENGGWIPSKGFWLKYGLTSDIDAYSLFLPTIYSPKGINIAAEMAENGVIAGSQQITLAILVEILKIWIHYPLDMLQIWCNRFFLALSMDGMKQNALYLIISYLAVLKFWESIKGQFKHIKDFFDSKVLIYFAFLFSILISCALHMEGRFAVAIQGLMLSFLVFDQFTCERKASLKNLSGNENTQIRMSKIPYTAIAKGIFVLLCIIHFGSLMELQAIEGKEAMMFTFGLF